MHIAGALGQGQWGDDGALQPCGLHLLCLDRLTITKQLLRRRALKEARRGAVLSRRCLQRGRRWYDIITVETIDSVVDKICSAGTSLQGGVRSRRRVRRRALKEAREEACMRWGATPSTSATSRTRTEEGVYASRLYPTYPDKPGSTMVTRTCKLDGNHTPLHQGSVSGNHTPLHQGSVTEEAQSNMAVLRVGSYYY